MSFHKCHVNSASRSQTQIHTQLLTLASSVSRPSRVRGIRGPQGRAQRGAALSGDRVCSSARFTEDIGLVGRGKRGFVLPRLQDADGPDMPVAQ